MGIPLEMPPFLDVVLTLSAVLALFAYIYRLAGKEGPPEGRLHEIKRIDSDVYVPTLSPQQRGPDAQSGERLTPLSKRSGSRRIMVLGEQAGGRAPCREYAAC